MQLQELDDKLFSVVHQEIQKIKKKKKGLNDEGINMKAEEKQEQFCVYLVFCLYIYIFCLYILVLVYIIFFFVLKKIQEYFVKVRTVRKTNTAKG